jgi:rhamnogalacturonyl hydrolase YesR
MAELAKAQGSEELMRLALDQVRIRQAACFNGQAFHRTRSDDGERGNRNWARGIAWQLLGTARTLVVAGNRSDISDLTAGLKRLGDWVRSFQRSDGLWSVFVDEPALMPDTGGSAGIAAALAIGANRGWLDASAKAAAAKALAGLQRSLTPDGFLTGVSQANKGGEPLQRSDYRVIYQMGMGLMGQLIAALKA